MKRLNKTHNRICRANWMVRLRYINGDQSVVEDAEIKLEEITHE